MLSKPIAVGIMILEIMYEFSYDYLLTTFGKRFWLCFMDANNFFYHIESEHILNKLKAISGK